MIYLPEYNVEEITGTMVYEAFRKISASAGPMGGWHPKELAYLSPLTCNYLAILLRQIEE